MGTEGSGFETDLDARSPESVTAGEWFVEVLHVRAVGSKENGLRRFGQPVGGANIMICAGLALPLLSVFDAGHCSLTVRPVQSLPRGYEAHWCFVFSASRMTLPGSESDCVLATEAVEDRVAAVGSATCRLSPWVRAGTVNRHAGRYVRRRRSDA